MDAATVAQVVEAAKGVNLNQEYVLTIKTQAKRFVNDNYRFPTEYDYLMIENAMLMGALIYAESSRDE